MGPAGLQVVMNRYANEINRHIANPSALQELIALDTDYEFTL